MKSALCFILLTALMGTFILSQHISAAEPDNAKSVFEKKCSACHTLKRIKSKKMTGEKWAKTVAAMKGKAEKKDKALHISNEEEKIISDYLAKEFGIK
jgi:cytochrome c5